ncbi:hypothetical protein A1O1_04787 [Capronia coronata CBS 617.96]|uniref:Transcription factor domain-containing protein n=1 Tax=Capronia coronata CBS 617.96 TaxID=1182541 RepID=W9YDZ5_9EURO|nr:uncharacterized protein A1O1_04787 [Capronia coronata CBS 617.96]EXJ87860.1 hypothetical protein A1O1_04787 [Capronia coronata CBS 617.96]
MSGPILASPLSATIEVYHPFSHSTADASKGWRSNSVSSKISPMHTIEEETSDQREDAASLSSNPATELGEHNFPQSHKSQHTVAPEIAEYVATIRAAIQVVAESSLSQKIEVGEQEQEDKLAFQSKAGLNAKRSSLILLKDKTRDSMSNVVTRGKRVSKIFTGVFEKNNQPGPQRLPPAPMDRERGSKPYSGRYVFVNSTADKLTRSRDEIFTISSHVSKTHRKWLKDERLKQLNASAGKAVAQRPIPPPQIHLGETRGRLPFPSLHQDAASTAAGSSRLPHQQTWPSLLCARSDQIPSNGMIRYSRDIMSSQHFDSFEGCQENDDQERSSRWKEYPRGPRQLSLMLWKGNSDPFQAAAVQLAPWDYEIIRQAQRFPVFAAWPDNASAVFRAPIADTTNSRIQLPQAIADEAEIHSILASGYHVAAGCSWTKSEVFFGRVLAHKTRSIALLRQKLLKDGFSEGITTVIRLLISLEFETGNVLASLVHLRALWAMSSSMPEILPDAQELLIVSDVWIALSLLKRPQISPSRYDPGGRSLQTFDTAFRLLESEGTDPYLGKTNRAAESVLDARTWGLLDAAHEIVNTKAIMDKIKAATIQQEVVWWMHRRATAVSGLLLTGYVDNTECTEISNPAKGLNVKRDLVAAACLCGILFMNLRFVDSPSNYNFSKTFRQIEPILRMASQVSREVDKQEHGVTYLWLLFMCAMGSDVYAARGDIPYSGWPAREFCRLCARFDLKDEGAIAATLGQLHYYPQMDDFIKALRSFTGESLDMPLISWSKWCDILNHYQP